MKVLRAYFVMSVAMLAACPTAVATTYYLSGTQRHTDFTLRATDRIIATGNLRLECARDARIDGTITGCPGFKIEVVAARELHVRGSIVAGHGVDGDDCLEAGTNGGSVELKGATFFLYSSTDIRGGRGGDAGPAGDGGNGGDITITATYIAVEGSTARISPGDAGGSSDGVNFCGTEGRDGGNGGDGGSVVIIGSAVPPVPGSAAACTNGLNGGAGGAAGTSTPGAGGAGGAGGLGTPGGAAGAVGTAGAAVLAPVAGTNGAAGSACP